MLLNIPVNSNDHVWMVASGFVGLQPDVEMNDISSPAITHSQVNTHWSVIEHRTRKQDIEVGKYTAQNLENMADLHGES